MEPARLAGAGESPRFRVAAKWIEYAPGRLVVPGPEWPEASIGDPDATIADIPAPGLCIGAGDPVLTLLATDSHVRMCLERLRRLRREWAARLGVLTTDS